MQAWADWLIDVHKRWHEGDPRPKPGLGSLFGVGGWVLVVVAIVEKIAGG